MLLGLIGPAQAATRQPVRPAVIAPIAEAPLVRVALKTPAGDIIVELDHGRAPATVTNFLRYVDQKRFDGTFFYRAMKLGDGQGLVQGGTANDPKRVLKPVVHEPTNVTGLKHLAGAISMARWGPGTANGDFSILVSALPSLDANPAQPGDNVGYAVFGYVVAGMDLVRTMLDAPTSPTLGEGFMKGQMLEPQIRIISVRRVAMPTATAKP